MADSLTLYLAEAQLLLAGWVRREPTHRLSLSRLAASWGNRHLLVPVVADVFRLKSMLSLQRTSSPATRPNGQRWQPQPPLQAPGGPDAAWRRRRTCASQCGGARDSF